MESMVCTMIPYVIQRQFWISLHTFAIAIGPFYQDTDCCLEHFKVSLLLGFKCTNFYQTNTLSDLFVTSNHQTTNLVFPIFFHEFFSVEQLKAKTNFSLVVQNWEKTCFGPIKSFFSFSTAKTEKNSWKKLVKTKLVVWWFDVTKKICVRAAHHMVSRIPNYHEFFNQSK